MKLAFALFKYFPYGGLEQLFLRVASACKERGHSIHVFTTRWEGPVPKAFDLQCLQVHGFQNHTRCRAFGQALSHTVNDGQFNAVVGFNKMPGLDVYFAGDPCYRAQVFEKRNPLYRLTGRCRTFLRLERSVFAPDATTQILLMVESEKEKFIRHYHTSDARFHVLPPGIQRDRLRPPNAMEIRAAVRRELDIPPSDFVVLMIGSDFKRKGLDRAIRGLAALDEELRRRTWLVVVGRGRETPYQRLASRLGVDCRLRILGARQDVPRLLWSADLLVHPAYQEAAGMALLEGLAAGLPVLTTDVCGYAFHVQRAKAGVVLTSPFDQSEFNRALAEMLDNRKRSQWQQNALAYLDTADMFALPERTADLIEELAPR